MKRAFTFVETMVATAVSGVVILAVGSAFVFGLRMIREAMAQTELSLAARQLREKLLFRAAPQIGGVTYAGLLSGSSETSVLEGGASPNIQMSCKGIGSSFVDLTNMPSQSIRIMMWGTSPERYLLNERMPNKDAYADWLRPGKISLADATIADVVGYQSSDNTLAGIYRLYLNINLKAKVKDSNGADMIRRERIAIPVFGRIQPMQDSGGGY